MAFAEIGQVYYERFYFLPNICFLSHYFGTRNVRKPIKPSKVSNYSLVSKKNLSQEMTCLVGAQGPMKWTKNT